MTNSIQFKEVDIPCKITLNADTEYPKHIIVRVQQRMMVGSTVIH